MPRFQIGLRSPLTCMTKIPCTCGCGLRVSYSTKTNHLNGRGKIALRARVLGEHQLLGTNTRQHQPTSSQVHRKGGTKKRLHAGDRDDPARRRKTAQPEIDEISETLLGDVNPMEPALNQLQIPEMFEFQADADHTESFPVPDKPSSAYRSSKVAERSRKFVEQRWRNGCTGHDRNSSEDEFEEGSCISEAENKDDEDKNEDDEDGDEDDLTDVPGISEWDLLGQDFERKAAAIGQCLSKSDCDILRIFTLKVEDHLTERTYKRLFKAFPDSGQVSLEIAKKRIRFLSGFNPIRYSCCINSCVCFVGPYSELDNCPNCNEPRFNASRRPRQYFNYLPLVPRLTAMASNRRYAETMRYRDQFVHEPGIVKDVFDGAHYRSLRETIVPSADPSNPFFFFSDPRDIALGLSTDGFAPFKRRDKTCWPLIMFNYNLPPELRFLKKYCIHLGTVPGPKKPWDWDSFCWPLAQELIQLEIGVTAFDALTGLLFLLHAYLLLGFGDIPAMALIMRMKGQNGFSPCRLCNIKGVSVVRTYYVPLQRDNIPGAAEPLHYIASNLPMRTHEEFIEQALAVEMAPTNSEREKLAKQYGIKGIPVLSSLSAVSFPSSFPFDFMHLIWENLMPNLILFWTGEFKDLDHEGQDYVIETHIWNDIGTATAACKATIPAAFGAAVPNVATKRSQMTSEMYSNWTLYIAPILLQNRFKKNKYYKHFMDLVNLLKLCLLFEMNEEIFDEIDQGFASWVHEYETLYYQNDPGRLSACPLTVHALLHISSSIKTTGPVWTCWAYPMERHCNTLLPAIRSRRYPYAAINSFVNATAQLDQIRLMYDLEKELCLDPDKKDSDKLIQDNYPCYMLSAPRRFEILPPPIRNKVLACLATRFTVAKKVVQSVIKLDQPVIQYGRVTRLEGGDRMVGRDLVEETEDSRDASFVRYTQLVDRHARQRNRRPEYVVQHFFGQLKRILVLELPTAPQLKLTASTTIILAVIQNAKAILKNSNSIYYYKELGVDEIVDLTTVQCVVGRIFDRNEWAIVDRSDNVAIQVRKQARNKVKGQPTT